MLADSEKVSAATWLCVLDGAEKIEWEPGTQLGELDGAEWHRVDRHTTWRAGL